MTTPRAPRPVGSPDETPGRPPGEVPGDDAPELFGLRAALRRWWGVLLGLVLGGAVAYAVGMDARSSVVMAVGVAALVVVCRRLSVGIEPEWGTELRRRQAGARGDLQDLAWSMAGRDGRAGERAMRRLREVAAVRLARHGLDLTSPDDTTALRALLGDRVLATLRRRSSPLPTVRELQDALAALEALGPRPADGRTPGLLLPDEPDGPDETRTPDHPAPGRNR